VQEKITENRIAYKQWQRLGNKTENKKEAKKEVAISKKYVGGL
jgi:hypothetical protein